MKSLAEHAMHRSPRGPVACVRLLLNWLLVAVLALDLAGSPLHAHRHDGEFSSAGTAWASAGHHADTAEAHVDDDDSAAFSHSITTLRGHVTDLPDAPTGAALVIATWWPVSDAATSAVTVRLPWPPDRHRAGASAFRSLPPDGRAPPLHA
jgi:hypothetical protein